MTPDSILLYVHPPYYKVGDEVFFDAQAQNGLHWWAQNFSTVRIMAPLIEEPPEGPRSDAVALQPFLDAHPSVEPVMLPQRSKLKYLLHDLAPGRDVIRAQIAASEYLVFGFSGYVGDWGTIACRTAARMGRPYAVWKDGVAHRLARVYQSKQHRSLPRKLWDGFENNLMEYSDRKVVQGADLSLLHGQDTIAYYGAFSRNPHLVHNIHISKADRITEAALAERLTARDPRHLRISYAGRVEAIKGPDQWTRALAGAMAEGVDISAKWYGTGVLEEAQHKQLADLGVGDAVSFAGFVAHKEMLAEICQTDAFVFTHLTDESPRCLIEALSAGLPLVGYDSAYARDLVGASDAGLFVPRGDVDALTQALKDLAADPDRLAHMAREARRVAEPFNDEDIFRERAEIIKEAF